MGKMVRRGHRILTGEIVTAHGPTGPRGVTVAPQLSSFSPRLETERELNQLNSGSNLLREARTKAQESYLSGVVYSTCRVDLRRYPGPGRYTPAPKTSRPPSHGLAAPNPTATTQPVVQLQVAAKIGGRGGGLCPRAGEGGSAFAEEAREVGHCSCSRRSWCMLCKERRKEGG